MGVLTAEQCASFRKRGFLRLESAFDEQQAASQREQIWRELSDVYGVREADRGTWKQPARQLRRAREHPTHLGMATARLTGAIDDLLGPGEWQRVGSTHWGSVLFTFPNAEEWDVPRKTWHWDNPIAPHLSGCAALQLFSLLAPLEPGGGATVFVEGMHRVLVDYFERLGPGERSAKHGKHRARVMKGHPWLRRLQEDDPPVDDRIRFFMEDGSVIDGHEVRVNEMVGDPGDVYLLHPLLVHTWAPNASDRPRMMRSKQVTKKDFDWGYMAGQVADV